MFAPGAGRLLGAVTAALVVVFAVGWAGLLPLVPWVVALAAVGGVDGFLLVFFRDPERTPGEGVVSAADGRIRAIDADGDRWRVSVFMNVTDVHVNRFPVDGLVVRVEDSGSGFRPAYRREAGHNVQRRYVLETAYGPVEVVQVTGVLARRLVSFVRVGTEGRKGERLGMIVLGSRVDVLLPAARLAPCGRVGDRVRAGTTPIARERA